ncbi:RidA family protein [Granulicella sibirica]|uniref:Endoribonuclease L-PSP n=1 Tax=Granulicella sibirica TaxID=2479048 RepID=A0A4Q0T9X4_9BACT|nr:Rid family hydrolase [Granulicella sibirica]RXH58566.1 Endoribonuclease L-PSP [Granulicella sibirica]
MSRQYFSNNPSRPFSDAVLIDGRTLYLSGRIGLLPEVDAVPESADDEAHLVLQDVQRILGDAGMGMEHLVFLQIFSPDVSLWGAFNVVYRQYFDGPMPPRSFLGSGPLLFGARFEVQGIAVKDSESASS